MDTEAQERTDRGECFPSKTTKIKTGCGSLFVTLGEREGEIHFISARLGKGGGCANAMCSTIGELAAEALRSGADPEDIVKILLGVGCSSRTQDFLSCADAIGHVLADFYVQKRKARSHEAQADDRAHGAEGRCHE